MPSREEVDGILRKIGCPREVIEHSRVVARLAVRIAKMLAGKGIKVDLKLVEAGALLHDIGRSKTHTVAHGSCGGVLAEALGLPDPLVRIIERHIGAGITTEEAGELGLPRRDFIPETLEEKIVAYADKLVVRNRVVGFKKSLQDFSRKLGRDHPAVERLKRLHAELTSLSGSEF